MKIGVFASGSGSNFEALALRFPVSFLVCDRLDAPVIARAERLGIKTYVIPFNGDKAQHETLIWQKIATEDFSLICLAGYKRLLSADFLKKMPAGSVVNIHPSILPKHPGLKGYEDSYADASTEGGMTVHEVDSGMDTGRIIAQKTFAKIPGETLEQFKARGLALENEFYPQVVSEILKRTYHHRVEVMPAAVDLLASPLMLNTKVMWIETVGPCPHLPHFAAETLSDPVSEKLFWKFDSDYEAHLYKLGFAPSCSERGFLAGVTDNAGTSMTEAWKLHPLAGDVRIRSGEAWRGSREFPKHNPLLQWERTQFNAFENIVWHEVKAHAREVKNIDLNVSDEMLQTLNQENWWALTLPELRLARDFFAGRGTAPTDVEMEIIAQTWSEHCKHKIFRAEIEFSDEDTQTTRTVNSLFKTFIKGVTDKVKAERNLDWLVSVFDDNAGVVRWDSQVDVAIKVETHNSPSALDPYGGALTGILGVNRDIMGVGMGARPIANTNVFCLAPNDLDKHLGEAWPVSVLSPARIRTGVHAGVKDGGNKSGIPTVNGAFHYDVNFAGKPLVYCGTLGVLPQTVNSKPSHHKPISPRDHVVMVGGRIGKDGLHGATFSSMELKDGTPASVVQIGDPLTQKRMMDFLLEARDLGLYSGITDNGAGGLSSSIGEMAQFTGGAEIDLALAPVKYAGLSPWELMVSESQERMTVAVPPAQIEDFLHLAQLRGVEATSLGFFNTSGVLKVNYAGKAVATLPLNFLHEGLPPMELKARWSKHDVFVDWCEKPTLRKSLPTKPDAASVKEAIVTLLQHANIQSHEAWVRQYDHEVQAASVMKPFDRSGIPCDAGLIAMKPHGGSEKSGLAVASGLAPQMSRYNPWLMGAWAVDESVRNVVCAGGDPERMALVDNFCWPDSVMTEKNPEGEKYLGMLVRTCEGMSEACLTYGLPLVSGKDSMKNDAHVIVKGQKTKISALPTLLMTCMAHMPDVNLALSSKPTAEGLAVVLIAPRQNLATLTLSECFNLTTTVDSEIDLTKNISLYRRFHQAFRSGLLLSAHDVSEGGLLTALAETSLDNVGYQVNVAPTWESMFGEGVAQIVVTCQKDRLTELTQTLGTEFITVLGETIRGGGLKISNWDLTIDRQTLSQAYKGGAA